MQAYNCDPDPDEPKRIACSFDPVLKGFCVSAEGVGDLAASAFSSYVEPVWQLGSCKTGMISPVWAAAHPNSPRMHSQQAIHDPLSLFCMWRVQG